MGLEAPFDDETYDADSDGDGASIYVQPVFENDEGEEEDSGASFSSLSCFRPNSKKKKMALVVDEEELAREHAALMQGSLASMDEEEAWRPMAAPLGLTAIGEQEEDEVDYEDTPIDWGEADSLESSEEVEAAPPPRKKKQMLFDHRGEGDGAQPMPDWFAVASEGVAKAESGWDDHVEEDLEEDVPGPPPVDEGISHAQDRPLEPIAPTPLIEGDLPGIEWDKGESAIDRIAERLFGPGGSYAKVDPDALRKIAARDAESPAIAPVVTPAAEPEFIEIESADGWHEPHVEDEEPAERISHVAPPPADEEAEPDPAYGWEPAPAEEDSGEAESHLPEALPTDRTHVMQIRDFDEEEEEAPPETYYPATPVQQSRLRARLIREVEQDAEPEPEGLFARLWRWIAGR